MLEPEHGLGVEEMRRPLATPLVLPTRGESFVWAADAVLGIRRSVSGCALRSDHVDAHATQQGGRSGEVLVDERLAETHRFESLCAGVGADDGDPHLRHDLQHTFAETLDQVTDRFLTGKPLDHAAAYELFSSLHGQVRVDRRCSVANKESDMVHLTHIPGLRDKPHLHAVLFADEVMVNCRK